MYKNSEDYPDPTMGEALSNIARQERAEKKAAMRQERKYMPRIYVCSPFAGDTQGNIEKARRYCTFAVRRGYIPYASHLFFPQFMPDDDPEQRKLGLFMGLVYLDGCRECWVFGDTISSGMSAEIERARKRGIVLRYFTEQCEEVSGCGFPRN